MEYAAVGGPGGIRTPTGWILSPLPLPGWATGPLKMVSQRGLEPPTRSLGNCCSVQLSYWDEKGRMSLIPHNERVRRHAARMAEGAGFEPAGLAPVGFQDRSLKPLRQPSDGFNSRARERRDPDEPAQHGRHRVSIHAPARGATGGATYRSRTGLTSLEGWDPTARPTSQNGLSTGASTRISGLSPGILFAWPLPANGLS